MQAIGNAAHTPSSIPLGKRQVVVMDLVIGIAPGDHNLHLPQQLDGPARQIPCGENDLLRTSFFSSGLNQQRLSSIANVLQRQVLACGHFGKGDANSR
jgi:hypothetical protein